jgi:hypothetical protein
VSGSRGPRDAEERGEIEGLRVEGDTQRGRRCVLIDRTGDALPRIELERLLGELIARDAFGFQAVGDAGGIPLGRARFAHVQIGARLYRLIVEQASARLERF